jgi:hypothetical protein
MRRLVARVEGCPSTSLRMRLKVEKFFFSPIGATGMMQNTIKVAV